MDGSPCCPVVSQHSSTQPPFLAVFPTLASYLSSLSQARGCPRPPDVGTRVHSGWPNAGHLPNTAEKLGKKKTWEHESSNVFFIPCLSQSPSLMGLSFCLVVSGIGLFMYVFISLLFVSLECKVYKDRYFCQPFLHYIPRVKDSGEPMVGTCYILE